MTLGIEESANLKKPLCPECVLGDELSSEYSAMMNISSNAVGDKGSLAALTLSW